MNDQPFMRTIYIDCSGVKSSADIWQRYLDAANPEGAGLFGRNLDAFWDAVAHGGPGWPGEAKIVFEHSSELAAIAVSEGSSLLDALGRIASEATQVRIVLA